MPITNKKQFIVMFVLSIFLFGATSKQAPDIFNPPVRIQVPKQFREGVGWRNLPSDYEMYLDAYRRGWWHCVENYVNDINYVSSQSDTMISGRGSEISGFVTGFEEAEKRIKKLIARFGKEVTLKYLGTLWEGW
jgi:hypothetical protein